MPTRVFVSFVYEDHAYLDQIEDWAKKGLLGDVEVITETEDVRQGGMGAVHGHLRPKLDASDLMLVLVGQDSHNRQVINWEIAHRRSNRKPVIPVRVPNTTGAAPPEIRGEPEVRFSPQTLALAIKEAKRKK